MTFELRFFEWRARISINLYDFSEELLQKKKVVKITKKKAENDVKNVYKPIFKIVQQQTEKNKLS